MSLDAEFETLEDCLVRLIALLDEADERFWARTMERGLAPVRARTLAGATFVLGCYGGQDTFSDLVLGIHLLETDPVRARNLDARLTELRNRTFDAANAIASRRSW